MFVGFRSAPRATILLLCLLLCLTGIPPFFFGQQSDAHEEVVVTASRLPAVMDEVSRSVVVLDRRQIESAPVHSLPELLEYVLGVDVRQRGPHGVQADLSLRGGTFEQTLILIDGVKVSDPQTGHHNALLPLTLEDVERVEILKGSGSRLYGPNAFGGVVNVITRKSGEARSRVAASAGQNGFLEGSATLAVPLGSSRHGFSFDRKRSGGYRENTDFDATSISWRSAFPAAGGELDLFGGHTDKAFGANGFYSDRFPNQWERTRTTVVLASGRFQKNGLSFVPKAYWRRNGDEFLLDRDRPEWYRNVHTTHSWGLEFQVHFATKLGRTAAGAEAGKDTIESVRLGDHSRIKGGFFLEHQWAPRKDFVLTAGVFVYRYSEWGWRAWPGLEAALGLSEGLRIFGSWNGSFRVPTYTELYYSDPANRGNPGLKPEKAGEYELGLAWKRSALEANACLFKRDGRDLIDWVRTENDVPWEARNIAALTTRGFEFQLRLSPSEFLAALPMSRIQLGYAHLDGDRLDTDGTNALFESKYALDHLRRQFLLDVEHALLPGIRPCWRVRYEERTGRSGHTLVDIRVLMRRGSWEMYLEATNLFDADHADIGNIPLPGRWVIAGLKIDLRPAR